MPGDSMKYDIYLDLYFLLNLLVNVSILFCYALAMNEKKRMKRCLMAAAAGAAVSCGILFLPAGIPAAGFLPLLTLTAFYVERKARGEWMKTGGLLFFLAFCMEGAIRAAGVRKGIGLILFFSFLFGREKRKRREEILVTLFFHGKKLTLTGFLDTGNRLTEPLTKKPVHVASYDAVKSLLPEEYRQAAEHYFQTGILEDTKVSKMQMYEFTFLSYHSIGNETGQLLGIRMDSAVYQQGAERRTEEKAVIALADQEIFPGGHCRMIMNGRLEL